MDQPSPESEQDAILLHGEPDTRALAGRIASLVQSGDVIALSGPLGAGKTAFARAFVQALAERSGEAAYEVPSPTFTLVQAYDVGGLTVFHFDLFRLGTPDEAWELGIEEAFSGGVSLIEWPERLGALLPARRLEIALAPGPAPDDRWACLRPSEQWRARLKGAGLA